MRLAYLGNHQPDLPPGVAAWSTETHWSEAFELAGHEVLRLQETEGCWAAVPARARDWGADFVFWTRTYGLDRDLAAQERGMAACRAAGIPVAAGHLDKFFGLPREHQVRDEMWFRADCVFTADGGNQDRFDAAGVDHVWLPPAVHEPECQPGTFRPELASDVAFVGSWQGGYHPEWRHRAQLVERLRFYYGPRVRFWPEPGGPQVRGRDLADLYASVKVLVGDSCLVDGRGFYASDRIPETLGRGGFLVHPWVDGITDGTCWMGGRHLATWTLGNWGELRNEIDHYLAEDHDRTVMAEWGREWTLAHHTYTRRAERVVEELAGRGLIG